MTLVLILTLPTFFVFALGVVVVFYVFISKIFTKRMQRNGEVIAKSTLEITQKFSDSIEDIKRISVLGLNESRIKEFEGSDLNLRVAIAQSGYWASSPRFYLETVVLIIALLLILVEGRSGNLINILPILAVTVVAVQKTLPAIQSIYQSHSFLIRSFASCQDCLRLMDLSPIEISHQQNVNLLKFHKTFHIKNINYGF